LVRCSRSGRTTAGRANPRGAFTLIELLVVIAIIGILAAMLFPVFARARESARKTQCLANVKNIAIAIQMYLTDYDKFYPDDHGAEAQAYFETCPGGGKTAPQPTCNRKAQANPFLRQTVILDEYVKSRDVYRCPSSKLYAGPKWIVPDYGKGYLAYLKETEGHWGRNNADCHVSGGFGPCCVSYPSGWGGTVSDSMMQEAAASRDTGAPEITIGFTQLQDVKESQVLDPTNLVVCGDMQRGIYILGTDSVLYNLCRTTTCGDGTTACCSADWTNCADTVNCGLDARWRDEWFGDPGFRAKYTPHMGGANLGFGDGHAKWWTAEALKAATPGCDENDNPIKDDPSKPIRGFCPVGVG
jgi:prepilin-type N-terminal cleavage/methylation domain-containing protein/prepilin-type processing-associated H-X9-DG protein